MDIHYTATLHITATETTVETKDRYDKSTATATRTVKEIANIIVRDETIEKLQKKITAHVALLTAN